MLYQYATGVHTLTDLDSEQRERAQTLAREEQLTWSREGEKRVTLPGQLSAPEDLLILERVLDEVYGQEIGDIGAITEEK